jgi:serine phosphatase RsbU (regulator of sigma subunit)
VLGDAPHSLAPPVGLPLGILPNASWTPVEVTLEPGWAMLLHTDGLIEGRGADPDELLWTEGLIDVLAAERHRDLDRLPERLVERAEQLNGGALVDDVAILLLSHDAAPSDAAPAGLAVAAGERA